MITEQDSVPEWPQADESALEEVYDDPSPVPVDPGSLPRLVRVECGADPQHGPMWMEYDEEDWYAPPCPMCAYVMMRDAHDPCRHSHHGAWRRWKVSAWLAGWAYQLGLIAGYGSTHDGFCRGCLDGFVWRPKHGRPYTLGWATWKWSCLLKKRHWPGGYVGFDCCTKCLPCPECGSTKWEHDVLQCERERAVDRADEDAGGRHRLSPSHPGWETAIDELHALQRPRRSS